ncbi:hypothetical protein RHGRI_018072 [Rhododendron griersonianum]|uniref:Ubiquitin-like protease family profile domain-containing protein n=1 Tax=Rhododendron griersonianum TaxID=479676 RepID=A0AAV6K097_9ERIC|nr:hypothetical protein RHGRI_018072 [Rhododendron griersonianum]
MQESRSQPVNGKKKRKRDRQEPEEQTEIDEEHTQVEQTQPTGSNRCNMQSICRLLKDTKLSDRHIVSFKKTPFWLLFEAVMNSKLLSDNCRKYDEVVLKIIQSYEEESRSFIVGDRQLKLTKEHVKLIFGISCGEVEMVEANVKKESVALAKRLEMKEARLSAPFMKQKIKELISSEKEHDVEDVVRLLCLYLCVTLFFSNQGTTVNWSFIQHMEDLERVKEYDWAEAIRKYLLMSVHNNHKDLRGLRGSTVLLLVNHTEVQETAEERKIFDEISGDHGDEQEGEKGGVQVSKDDGGEKDDEAQKVQGLDDFNSPICRSYETDSGVKLVNHTEVQETAEERKIFDEIFGDHGDEQGQVSKDHKGEQGEAKVTEVEPTIGVVHGGDQVGVCGEEEGEKGGVQVSKDDGGEKDDEAEKVQGLDDFNSPICRSYETDSGSTLVPNTLGQMSSPNTTPIASLNTICGTIEEQGKKDANAFIDEMKNKIEKLEIEKQNLEIEIIKIQEQNEKALQSRNEENGMLKQRIQTLEKHATALQKKNDKLQNGNKLLLKEKEDLEVKVKELDAKVEDFEIHQLTQAYPMETEREVHEVTQHAIFEKIASLEKEKNDMEDELACMTVHEITQEAAKEKMKLKKSKEQCSPRSMFKRVIARDDRKQNYSEDYVYGQAKRKSPQVDPIDVDNSPDYEQQQKGKKKMLKKLKVNTEIDTIDVDESQEYEQREKGKKKKLKNLKVKGQVAKLICPETWKKIEQLWKTGEPGTVVMKSPQDVIYVELLDIENLLFDDPISNRDIIENKKQEQLRRMLHNLMRQAASARFLLFPILASFHWTLLVLDKDNEKWKLYNPLFLKYGKNNKYSIISEKLRITVAAYINADKKQAAKMVMSDTVEVQKDSPQQEIGSLDCGIIVMSIMRKYIENENPTSAITRQDWHKLAMLLNPRPPLLPIPVRNNWGSFQFITMDNCSDRRVFESVVVISQAVIVNYTSCVRQLEENQKEIKGRREE